MGEGLFITLPLIFLLLLQRLAPRAPRTPVSSPTAPASPRTKLQDPHPWGARAGGIPPSFRGIPLHKKVAAFHISHGWITWGGSGDSLGYALQAPSISPLRGCTPRFLQPCTDSPSLQIAAPQDWGERSIPQEFHLDGFGGPLSCLLRMSQILPYLLEEGAPLVGPRPKDGTPNFIWGLDTGPLPQDL